MVLELGLGCVLIAELTAVVHWKFLPWFRLYPLQTVTGVFLSSVRYHLTPETCGVTLAGRRLDSLFLSCQQKSRHSFLLLWCDYHCYLVRYES